MEPDRAPVVADLLAINQHLVVSCCWPECRRSRRLAAVEAVQLLGPGLPIAQAARRLRCSACGARGREKLIEVRPCTLDAAAASARQAHAKDPPPAWPLEDYLASLRGLLAGGELGGDGPVQAPVDGASKPG